MKGKEREKWLPGSQPIDGNRSQICYMDSLVAVKLAPIVANLTTTIEYMYAETDTVQQQVRLVEFILLKPEMRTAAKNCQAIDDVS